MVKMYLRYSKLVLLIFVFSCHSVEKQKDEFVPSFSFDKPDGFPPMIYPQNPDLSQAIVSLGKELFKDSLLHINEEFACVSCHIPQKSFTSPELRNDFAVMPLINMGWDIHFLWFGDISGTLEDAMLFEIEEFFKTDMIRLNQDHYYQEKFEEAFGKTTITTRDLANAMAHYLRTVTAGNSRFDKFTRGEVNLTDAEYRGYELFFSERGDCFHCHGTVFFKDNEFHNNGLNEVFEGNDRGRYLVTGDSMDLGKFKTPTLRNIALTAPYMHDNRYATLKEVLDFYSDSVNFTPFTDPLMNHEGGINMTEQEKADLLSFLYTLTDSTVFEK